MNHKKQPLTEQYLYGTNPIVEVISARRRKILAIYTTKNTPREWPRIKKLLQNRGIQPQFVGRDALTRMADGQDHQGVVALVQPFPFAKQMFTPSKHPFLLMLDGIQDPRNLGAIIRSAYCSGVDGVIITSKSSAPLNAVAIKSSAGYAEHMPIYRTSTATEAATQLKRAGYTLYLATFDGVSPTEYTFKTPLCLVVGSEGAGISKNILKTGTHVTLPQKNPAISYNASVAAGILLFTISSNLGHLKHTI